MSSVENFFMRALSFSVAVSSRKIHFILNHPAKVKYRHGVVRRRGSQTTLSWMRLSKTRFVFRSDRGRLP